MHCYSLLYFVRTKADQPTISFLSSLPFLLDVWFCIYTHAQLKILIFQDSVYLKSIAVHTDHKRVKKIEKQQLFCNADKLEKYNVVLALHGHRINIETASIVLRSLRFLYTRHRGFHHFVKVERCMYSYRITSNKRLGRLLNFLDFRRGV